MNLKKKSLHLLLLLTFLLAGCGHPAAQPDLPAAATPTPPPQNVQPPQDTPGPTPSRTPTQTTSANDDLAGLLKNARQAYFYGDYESARKAYQNLYNQSNSAEMQSAALLGNGQTAWAQGDTLAALEAFRQVTAAYPQTAAAADAWFLLGEAYFSLQRYAEAEEAYWQYLTLRPGILDDYAQERRGDAYAAQGDYLDALDAYQAAQQFPAPEDRTDLEIKIAQTHATLGDYATALAMYADIQQRADNDLVRARINYLTGETYLTLGEAEKAYQYFQQNLQNYPLAYETYLSLVELVDHEVPVDNFLRGLVDYYAGQYGAALNALQQAQRDPAPAGNVYYYLGLTQRANGYYPEAIATWQQYIEAYPSHAHWVDAWEDIAFTQWAYLNRPDAAAKTLMQFVQRMPAAPQTPGILYDAARMYERSGQLDAAASAWEQLAATYPNDGLAAESIFQAGLIYYRQGNLESARNAMERTLAASGAPRDQSRAHLWIGKIYQEEGQTDIARQIWTQGAVIDPTGYYSERMRDLLLDRPPFEAPAVYDIDYDLDAERDEAAAWMRLTFNLPADTDLNPPGPLADDLRFHRGLEFWRLGLYDQARAEYESLRLDMQDDPANSFRLAAWLTDLGLYRSAIFAARNVLDLAGMDDASTLTAPVYFNHIRFGTYYRPLVESSAAQNGLHPLFLWSVIRQESLFEGFVQSNANAHGLMQIIPSTGKNLAEKLGWPPNYTQTDLYRPVVSIRLGSAYLASNRDLLDGNLYAALAAYNGGPANAAAWLEMAHGDPDLLLEVIRYSETRNYIRGIYEVFNIYRRLYSPAE